MDGISCLSRTILFRLVHGGIKQKDPRCVMMVGSGPRRRRTLTLIRHAPGVGPAGRLFHQMTIIRGVKFTSQFPQFLDYHTS